MDSDQTRKLNDEALTGFFNKIIISSKNDSSIEFNQRNERVKRLHERIKQMNEINDQIDDVIEIFQNHSLETDDIISFLCLSGCVTNELIVGLKEVRLDLKEDLNDLKSGKMAYQPIFDEFFMCLKKTLLMFSYILLEIPMDEFKIESILKSNLIVTNCGQNIESLVRLLFNFVCEIDELKKTIKKGEKIVANLQKAKKF